MSLRLLTQGPCSEKQVSRLECTLIIPTAVQSVLVLTPVPCRILHSPASQAPIDIISELS